jgi:hypothetical protein
LQENLRGSSISQDVEILASPLNPQLTGAQNMKRLLATLALTCVLSTSALAGSIPTCGIVSEEPPPDAITGNIPTTDATLESEAVLDVLLTILSVF